MVTIDRKDDYLFVKWSSEVKRRDHYICQICGRRGVNLHAHHILSWSDNPDDRYDLDNGITLCLEDHEMFHDIYGKGGNNKKQLDEFKEMYYILISQAADELATDRKINNVLKFADGYESIYEILDDLEKKEGVE